MQRNYSQTRCVDMEWGWVHESTRGWDGVGIMITVTGGVGIFFLNSAGLG